MTEKEEIFKGLGASKGISIGKPFVYHAESPSFTHKLDGEVNVENEIVEYEQAVEQSKKELTKILHLAKSKLDEKNLMIFEAHILFLEDAILHQTIKRRIKKEKKTAYQIFNDEIKKIEKKLLASNDDYIRERVLDIEDIRSRVLRNINKKKLVSKIDENSIVIARKLTPADTILFSNRNLLGFATELGGINSHVAIIARSINVPAIVGVKDISLHIKSSDYIIIDGYKGIIIKNPSEKTISKYNNLIKKYSAFEKKLDEFKSLPTITKDGKKISLSVNLQFDKEIDYIITHIGCGVGLYRTEHMFLETGDFPDEEEQYKQYKMIAERLYPNTITIRTFDIGGDKLLPDSQKELNPYLGWRGIRISLDKEDVFLTQLQAILRASQRGNIRIMFPMISGLDELLKVKELFESAKKKLKKKSIPFDKNMRIGIMVEVPSAVLQANELAKEVDFFRIGTNDLIQYILAVDRDSSIVSDLYQQFHPAVIRALSLTIKTAHKNNIEVSVCGEMAGDTLGSLLLLGLGVNDLSVETTSYLRIKRFIMSMNYKQVQNIAEKVLNMNHESEIEKLLSQKYDEITEGIEGID
jgi:phosphotransferase system enzyme I (PtsI)